MRYQVWAFMRVATAQVEHAWRPVSRPFNEEREAQGWALDLSDWFRQRMDIRRVP